MQEKSMVSDALNTLNSGLKTYTDMLSQTDNQELRSVLQQMRNETEQSQQELFQLAKNKNYYHPAGQASQNDINSIKSIFLGSTGWSGNSGTSTTSGNTDYNVTSGNTGMSGGTSGVGGSGNYNNSGLTGSQEGLGLTGSAGMNTNTGAYGNKGMTNMSDASTTSGGKGSTKKSTTK